MMWDAIRKYNLEKSKETPSIMKYSIETIYHFTCQVCSLWWSIAAENINMNKQIWVCPWCGHRHKPPHMDKNE